MHHILTHLLVLPTINMAKLALLLLGLGLASAGVIVPVPDPYRWDESFTVKMPQMDDEHRGLFNGLLLVERVNNEENLQKAVVKYHDHFALEESLFKQTMSSDYIADHVGKRSNFFTMFDCLDISCSRRRTLLG